MTVFITGREAGASCNADIDIIIHVKLYRIIFLSRIACLSPSVEQPQACFSHLQLSGEHLHGVQLHLVHLFPSHLHGEHWQSSIDII